MQRLFLCRLRRRVLTGRRPRAAGDFCFGKSHQNHFAPRLTYRDVLMPRAHGCAGAAFGPPLKFVVGNLGASVVSGGPSTALPCADERTPGSMPGPLRDPTSSVLVFGLIEGAKNCQHITRASPSRFVLCRAKIVPTILLHFHRLGNCSVHCSTFRHLTTKDGGNAQDCWEQS